MDHLTLNMKVLCSFEMLRNILQVTQHHTQKNGILYKLPKNHVYI
jgi:hypothetical protein